MFLFLLYVSSSLISYFNYSLFLFLKVYCFHILRCSYYPQSADFDSATIAIQPASYDQIISSALYQTMVYAVSTHNNLGSPWLKLLYSLECFSETSRCTHHHHHHHHHRRRRHHPSFPKLLICSEILT